LPGCSVIAGNRRWTCWLRVYIQELEAALAAGRKAAEADDV
jgi:hypothetical protein